jgi:hypothetical protein
VDFVAVVDQVIALLRQRGRTTYSTLNMKTMPCGPAMRPSPCKPPSKPLTRGRHARMIRHGPSAAMRTVRRPGRAHASPTRAASGRGAPQTQPCVMCKEHR